MTLSPAGFVYFKNAYLFVLDQCKENVLQKFYSKGSMLVMQFHTDAHTSEIGSNKGFTGRFRFRNRGSFISPLLHTLQLLSAEYQSDGRLIANAPNNCMYTVDAIQGVPRQRGRIRLCKSDEMSLISQQFAVHLTSRTTTIRMCSASGIFTPILASA